MEAINIIDVYPHIINAMVAAETMTGANGLTVYGLPHDRLKAVLKKYNRLVDQEY